MGLNPDKLSIASPYFIYIAAILAILEPGPSFSMKWLLDVILIAIMTLSIVQFDFSMCRKENIRRSVFLAFVHYAFLSGLLLLSTFLVPQQGYRQGIILLAAVPPAISIMGISRAVNGKVEDSFLAMLFSYLAAFAFMPLVMFIMLGEQISYIMLLKTMLMFIVLPFLLSRVLKMTEATSERGNTIVINILYAFLFYIVIGLKSEAFLEGIGELWPILLIMVLLSFGIGTLFFFAFRRKGDFSLSFDMMLFGTYKNTALAAVIAINLFTPDSLVPISIRALLSPLFVIYLLWLSKAAKTENNQKV